MLKQPLTSAQDTFMKQMRFHNVDERAIRILEQAFIFRNTASPSGVLDAQEATAELFDLIDEVP